MIRWQTINSNPSNPQQPIQQPYVKRTSKLFIHIHQLLKIAIEIAENQ